MTKHYDTMHKLGLNIMSHIAEGLRKPIGFFEPWFINNTCSTFRIIRYLTRKTNLVDQDKLSAD